jgi:hypothetical protein
MQQLDSPFEVTGQMTTHHIVYESTSVLPNRAVMSGDDSPIIPLETSHDPDELV